MAGKRASLRSSANKGKRQRTNFSNSSKESSTEIVTKRNITQTALAEIPVHKSLRRSRRLVGLHGTLNEPDPRGRTLGKSSNTLKPAEELSQNPTTQRNRERVRRLPADEKELLRRKNNDANARLYLRNSLCSQRDDGSWRFPDYMAMNQDEQKIFLENKYDEQDALRYRSEKSAEWFEQQLEIKERIANEEYEDKIAEILDQNSKVKASMETNSDEEGIQIGQSFLSRLDVLIKKNERKIYRRGYKVLEKAGDPNAKKAFEEFASKVLDPENIGNEKIRYKVEYTKEAESDNEEGLENVVHKRTVEGVTVVLEDDEESEGSSNGEVNSFVSQDSDKTESETEVEKNDEEEDDEEVDEDA